MKKVLKLQGQVIVRFLSFLGIIYLINPWEDKYLEQLYKV